MKDKLPFLAVLVLGVMGIAAILYFSLRSPDNNENFPEGTWWVCTNKSAPNPLAHTHGWFDTALQPTVSATPSRSAKPRTASTAAKACASAAC